MRLLPSDRRREGCRAGANVVFLLARRGGKKAIVIFVPVPQVKAFHKIQGRCVLFLYPTLWLVGS